MADPTRDNSGSQDQNTPNVEQIKAEAVKAAKDALISSLQGDKPKYAWEAKGKEVPQDYDELFEEVDKRTVKPDQIDEIVDKRLQDREDARKKADDTRSEEEKTRKTEDLKTRQLDFDREWYELVRDGKLPAPSKDIQEKIEKGEKLTREEIESDEGMTTRLKLGELAFTGNKSAKLAFYEDYGKEPAGASAPVIGGRPSAPQKESNELQYEDVSANRKKIFGF